jgi:hypothetical protein
MKYKNYIWIVFIFVAVLMVYGVFQYLKPKPLPIVNREGFMTEAEYLEEINHRIKSIQTIRGSIVSSLDSLDASAKESCDLSTKYREAYIAATAALPKYLPLKPEERLQNAKEDYIEEKTRFASQNTPLLECFQNPAPAAATPEGPITTMPATAKAAATPEEGSATVVPAPSTPVQQAQLKLMAEIEELNKVLASRRLRIAKDKGKLVQGLQEFNSKFSGTQLMNEMGMSAPVASYIPMPIPTPANVVTTNKIFKRTNETDSSGSNTGTSREIVCDEGSYVSEIFGRTGAWFDKIGIKCSNNKTLDSYGGDGGTPFSLVSDSGFNKITVNSGDVVNNIKFFVNNVEKASYGNGGGKDTKDLSCDDGKIMGLKLNTDTYVNKIQVVCGKDQIVTPAVPAVAAPAAAQQ